MFLLLKSTVKIFKLICFIEKKNLFFSGIHTTSEKILISTWQNSFAKDDTECKFILFFFLS